MKFLGFIFSSLIFGSDAFAAELSLDDVWKNYFDHSKEMESLRKEKEANVLASERGKLHWTPKISLMTQWSSSNDPGQVFINNLGQRAVTQLDFIPSSLNFPKRKEFLNGVLGVDLPLYEGGMKMNQSSMFSTLVKASEIELKAKKTNEFTELSRLFGSLIIHENNSEALKKLQDDLKRIISSYQVGSSSNPVGYSGLLGLKGVANRINGLMTTFNLQFQNSKKTISERSELSESWKPLQVKNIKSYINSYLTEDNTQILSSMLLAHELKASAMDSMAKMESARYLPKLGLFAQNHLYSGDRDVENSQSYGVYLMWEIFNNDSFNRYSEARAKALSAKAKIIGSKREENIMRSHLRESKVTLEKNLDLLFDSNNLLSEQAKNSMKLFKNGLMNALQLAEVINRRVDVIEQKNNAELQYLDVRSRLHQLSH